MFTIANAVRPVLTFVLIPVIVKNASHHTYAKDFQAHQKVDTREIDLICSARRLL